MSEIRITAIRKERGIIVAVLTNEGEYGLNTVIDHIKNKDQGWKNVYTFAEGFPKARVFVRELFFGSPYLCTTPDRIKENNLGELPQF